MEFAVELNLLLVRWKEDGSVYRAGVASLCLYGDEWEEFLRFIKPVAKVFWLIRGSRILHVRQARKQEKGNETMGSIWWRLVPVLVRGAGPDERRWV